LTQEQATDLGVSALDRGQLDNSRALIKVKILFGSHRDISAQKLENLAFSVEFFPKK
jgi:predicted dinucleotide-binding enzyme